jgi:hypothetical protein
MERSRLRQYMGMRYADLDPILEELEKKKARSSGHHHQWAKRDCNPERQISWTSYSSQNSCGHNPSSLEPYLQLQNDSGSSHPPPKA